MATQLPWHRAAVGGLWDELGQLQFEFLVSRGLRPHHHVLDIGCGSLRAGVKLIAYLDAGHYHGVDKDAELLRCGRELELTPDLRRKAPTLTEMEDFELHRLGRRFDFALAQSVFTHLPVNRIARCLTNVHGVLARPGVLYATFFENDRGAVGAGASEMVTIGGSVAGHRLVDIQVDRVTVETPAGERVTVRLAAAGSDDIQVPPPASEKMDVVSTTPLLRRSERRRERARIAAERAAAGLPVDPAADVME